MVVVAEGSLQLVPLLAVELDGHLLVISINILLMYHSLTLRVPYIYIVYVIESAAYGVLFTSCLCQKP